MPRDEFKKYWNRRLELSDVASNDMVSVLEDAFVDPPEPTPEELDEQKRRRSQAGRDLANARWGN